MNSSTRLALLLALQLAAGAAFLACGGGSDDADSDTNTDDPAPSTGGDGQQPAGNDTNGGTLQLANSPMYSAFVEGGMHEAQVPVALKDTSLRGKGAKFTSSDPSIAEVRDTAEGGLVTVKKDGTVTIKAELDGESGTAKLIIKKYTEAQWMAGQARFSKSDLALVPPPGGAVNLLTLAMGGMRNPNGACNTCHTAQARTLKIENTPTQIAGYSDDDLITIFTMGKKPMNVGMASQIPAFAWGMFHSWTVTEEEKQGLIAFLRTQAPKANPAMIDYGVTPCPGSPPPMAGRIPMLCDPDGKPIVIPGLPGQGGSTGTGTDAGTSTTATPDAGTGATAGDAG